MTLNPSKTNLTIRNFNPNEQPDAALNKGKPPVYKSVTAKHKKIIRDLRRRETAVESIAEFQKGVELFGFTKGQFSVIDLINAVIHKIGHAEYMAISTWAAAKADVHQVFDLINSGNLDSARWLIDYTFQRRMPGLAQEIRKTFGANGIRVAKNNAKFTLIRNEDWRIVIRTSMNINFNPRFEDFTLSHDPELFEFIDAILDDVWKKQGADLAFEKASTIEHHFRDTL